MPYRRLSTPVIVCPVFINGVTVVREMAKKGAYVVAVDPNPDSIGFKSRYVKERIVLPSPQEKAGCLPQWLLSRKDLYGAIVIPTDDFYVRELHAAYDRLSPHYKLAVSPGQSTATTLEKELTYPAARAAGIPLPRTEMLSTAADLAGAAESVGFPAILRPSFSLAFRRQFGTKSFPVNSLDELERGFEKAASAGHEMMLQEVIPGGDANVVSCKVYATDAGEVLGAVPGVKLSIFPPRFGTSQIQEARSIPLVEDYTRRLLSAIGFRGSLASVEWKYDERESTWKLLEINPRSVMAIALMKFVGADILDMLWRDKCGLPQLPPRPIKYNRRWTYLKNGLLLYQAYPEERQSLRTYMRRYRPPLCFGLFDPRDMKPFLYDIAPIVRRRLGKQTHLQRTKNRNRSGDSSLKQRKN